MPRFLPYIAIVALLLPSGCGDRATPAAVPASPGPTWLVSGAPGPQASGGAPSASASADVPPGARACGRLAAAVRRATLMDPGVIDDIVAASDTADAPVADAAGRLASAYAAAVASKGGAKEPDAVAAVSEAAADMSGVCNDSGLDTVG